MGAIFIRMGKKQPTQLDFTEALEGWINDND